MDKNILNRDEDWANETPVGREWEYYFMDTLSNSKGRGGPWTSTAQEKAPTPEATSIADAAKKRTRDGVAAAAQLGLVAAFMASFICISLYCMGAAAGLVLGAGMATFNLVVGK